MAADHADARTPGQAQQPSIRPLQAVRAGALRTSWLPEAQGWFRSLKLSGHAEFYEASDWATAMAAVGLTRFDGHPSSGVYPREDVRSWRAWGQAPAAPSCVHA